MTDSEDGGSTAFSKSLPRAVSLRSVVTRLHPVPIVELLGLHAKLLAGKMISLNHDPEFSFLISNRMEQRLESIEKLLQVLASTAKTPSDNEQSTSSSSNFTPAGTTAIAVPTPQVEQFEGESSLVAHSRQAHEALQRLLESAPITIRNDPNTVSALAALRNLLEKHRSEPPSLNLLSKDGSPQDLQYSDLPPREEVLMLLAYVEADPMSDLFTWWLFEDIEDFYKMYDEFCQSPVNCPLAISILVYCALCWLLDGNPIMTRAGVDVTKYSRYVSTCERHLESLISSYSLFLEPTELNIAALSAAGAYAIYVADVNAAWIMTSSAARLCQSLGWHRLTPERCGGDEKYHRKAVLFWSVYFIDKSLSLRLGRASAMQDYDISTSLKDLCGVWDRQEGGHHKMFAGWVELSIEMASLQGVIYDRLYSPGSTKSLSERQKVGQDLIIKIHEILVLNNKCFGNGDWLLEYTDFYKESGDVVLYSLFTLVYRAMPDVSNAHPLSLQAARSTMQVHYSCSKKVEAMGAGVKIEYMTWSIMLCPFTPFIVLFRNVITDLNLDDLKLLEDFVTSIEWINDKSQREPLQRFGQLCQAFYNLAKHFVAARLRADNEHRAMTSAGQTLVLNTMQQPDFGTPPPQSQLGDMAFPEDFQTWMDTNMDFMNDNWLAFGTL
ncbi:hypothetical protein D6C85_09298 [Aureobasidium pullulans]|uniref:Xylanolytic transcriptional activator regulatory domain-containing protein n=1 Tax=Aureobasidium pullulans TaxID=5580 RepID=A0A4S9WBP0_AURPU|nr:hypothetical protein D6C85_09298 [Aureobasidium pullulans]